MNLKKIALISRPRFWLYIAGPYLIGYTAGLDTTNVLSWYFRFEFIYPLFYFLIPANILIYGVNDYFDTFGDKLNPKKMAQEKVMEHKERLSYSLLISISFLFSTPLFLSDEISNIWLVLFFFIGFFYSAPPLRLKAQPLLDFLSNAFYIFPGIIAYLQQNDNLNLPIVIAAFSWSWAMHLFSAIPDIEVDKKAGITTTATLFGKRASLFLCSIFWGLTIYIATIFHPIFSLGIIYPLIPLILLAKNYSVAEWYWKFPSINAVSGFLIYLFVFFR